MIQDQKDEDDKSNLINTQNKNLNGSNYSDQKSKNRSQLIHTPVEIKSNVESIKNLEKEITQFLGVGDSSDFNPKIKQNLNMISERNETIQTNQIDAIYKQLYPNDYKNKYDSQEMKLLGVNQSQHLSQNSIIGDKNPQDENSRLDTKQKLQIIQTIEDSDTDSDNQNQRKIKTVKIPIEQAKILLAQNAERQQLKEFIKIQEKTESNYYESLVQKALLMQKKTSKKNKKKIQQPQYLTKEEVLNQQSEPVEARENLVQFIKNYGINIEIPTQNIQICRFFPQDPRYSLQIIQFQIPGDFEVQDENNYQIDENQYQIQSKNNKQFDMSPMKFDKANDQDNLKDEPSTLQFNSDKQNQNEQQNNKAKTQNLSTKSIVKTYKTDGRIVEKSFNEQYGKYQFGFYLKLLFNENGNGTQNKGQIIFEKNSQKHIRNIEMKFSNDSQFLAIFIVDTGILRIFKIKDLDILQFFHNIIQNIQNGENEYQKEKILSEQYYWTYQGLGGLDWVKNISFDKSNKYLVLYGAHKLQILDLDNRKYSSQFDLSNIDSEEFTYDRILDVVLDSNCKSQFIIQNEDQNYQCQIACKRKGMKQVDVFDINTDFRDEDQITYLRSIPYLNDLSSKDLYAKISYDFQKVLVINGQKENFILEYEYYSNDIQIQNVAKQTSIRRLPQIDERKVMFINTDNHGNFFIVCSHEFDHELSIIHSETNKNQFEIQIERTVQPGVVQCFDMNLNFLENNQECILRLLSATDNGFTLDQIKFKYKSNINEIESISKKIIINENNDKKSNIEFKVDMNSSIQAFSTKWPYVAFSVIHSNAILLFNAYDNQYIHRIILPNNPDKICLSFITETNDLFIMTQKDNIYSMHKVDFDAGNRRENKDQDFDKYTVQNLFCYQQQQVDYEPLLDIHVRGSSSKEKIDNNERLMIFILHRGSLYSWLQKIKDKDDSNKKFDQIQNLQSMHLVFMQKQDNKEAKLYEQKINELYKNYLPLPDEIFNIKEKVIKTVSKQILKQDDQCFYVQQNQINDGKITTQKILRFVSKLNI